jgi:hypothetical protein
MFVGPQKGLEISPDFFFQNEEGRAKTISEALYKLKFLDQCIIAKTLLYSEVIRK